jgi:hypothetical protein
MGKRERIRLCIALAAIVLGAFLVVCFMFSVRPIVASKEALILNENDLTGWELDNTSNPRGNIVWQTSSIFYNSSVNVGSSLNISVYSFWTCLEAHVNLSAVEDASSRTWDNGLTPIEIGDEGVFFLSWENITDPDGPYDVGHNGTIGRYTAAFANYLFREGNVLVLISFETEGYSLDLNDNYSQPWMNDIVKMQADKIHENIEPLSHVLPY